MKKYIMGDNNLTYYIKVEPNVKIYVEDINPKGNKTILFIHGWPADHNLFEYQFNKLPALGFRCIGIDIRGFGNSDRPFGDYSYNRLSDDVRAVVDALKLQNFTLAGHSVGGAIAIRYMARHHSFGVSKLALFAPGAPSIIKRKDFPYGVPKEEITSLIEQTYSDRPKMLQNFGEIFFFQNITVPFSDWFFNLGLKAAGWSTAAVAKNFINETLFSDLNKINVPTLILHGIHDKVCLFELGVALNKAIKNSKLVPFQYSGHGLFYEEKEKFNKELVDFIG
jgi:non-heme chloroperoxidase